MSACENISLPRKADRALADTAPEAPSSAKPRTVSQVPPALEASHFADVRRTLRQLVAAEEAFFAENGSYTQDLSTIGVKPEPDVSIRFLWLSRGGWAASGVHAELPGKNCIVFVGQRKRRPTTLKYGRPGRLGTPVCDEPRTAAPQPAPTEAAPAAAKSASIPDPASSDTGNALDALDPRILMKVDLRNLAHSQETFFAMQGFYAKRSENLALQYLWHKDVQVRILAADAQSWTAKATHARFPGKSCVIWFGPVAQPPVTDAQRRHETRPGVPVCDQ